MIFITGSKKSLLYFYFKNNTFSKEGTIESYYIKPYFIQYLEETIINYCGIYKLYYSKEAPQDKIIVYKENYEYTFYK